MVSIVGSRTFDTCSPLERAVNVVGAPDGLPGDWSNVGGRCSQNTRALAEVGVLVSGDGVGPGLVEVVVGDVGVLDDKVGL